MKATAWIGSAILFLAVGTAAPAFARPQDDKPKQDEAKPAEHHEEAKPDEKAKPEEKAKPKPEEHAAPAHPQAHEMAPHGSGRIPDDKFKAHFGVQHRFRVGHIETFEGHPRFQYGGYYFNLVDPWPARWAYSDLVYVDFIDGNYYLIDPVYPGVRLAIVVAP
ncbi:MAG: hypothetical protein WA002_02080 [Candidatus Acidiferrales bacterium]